jgi:hypothetical protein
MAVALDTRTSAACLAAVGHSNSLSVVRFPRCSRLVASGLSLAARLQCRC